VLTRATLLADATDRLRAADIDDARRNAEWIVEDVLRIDRAALLTRSEEPVTADEKKQVEALVERRARREPIQYVLGHADFFGLRLRVSPDVLIPRPETEELVEAALTRLEAVDRPWVLDVGTGSGAIALAIRHARPDAEVFACDVSPKALAVASVNAGRLGLDVTLVEADALAPEFASGVPACFDLLVSNPPYIPDAERSSLQPEVRDHEPHGALFAGHDALVFYRAFAGHAGRVVKPGGGLLVECHADYAGDVRDLFVEAGFTDVSLRRDLAGRDRLVGATKPG
jgi:release factor glutamine methyltransferase